MPKRAQHREHANLRSSGSTNLGSSVATFGGSSSIPQHTVQQEYSSAHVGAYFLMSFDVQGGGVSPVCLLHGSS